jgi:putative sugar O-methyltransferase
MSVHEADRFLERQRQSPTYQNYLRVRSRVLEMLSKEYEGATTPSAYWRQELDGFEYMLDASPLIINRLREHCYHLTGIHSYEYRPHHAHRKEAFANKLNALRGLDGNGELFVAESGELGGFGHEIDGRLVNIDTLKFYESIIALDKAGLLGPLREQGGDKKMVVEIGGGWGGFAYQVKTLCPKLCYVIIDLPQTLLFSAVYLTTLFPNARSFIYGDSPLEDPRSYDLVFLPHYFIEESMLPKADLIVNMVSFQEMTDAQVLDYARWAWDNGCSHLYSHNRGRSPHNPELSLDVDSILCRGYTPEEVKVLSVPYTVIEEPVAERNFFQSDPRETAKVLIRKMLAPKKKRRGSVHHYRHVVWHRQGSFQA